MVAKEDSIQVEPLSIRDSIQVEPLLVADVEQNIRYCDTHQGKWYTLKTVSSMDQINVYDHDSFMVDRDADHQSDSSPQSQTNSMINKPKISRAGTKLFQSRCIRGFQVFDDFLLVHTYQDGQERLQTVDFKGNVTVLPVIDKYPCFELVPHLVTTISSSLAKAKWFDSLTLPR